MVRTVSLIASSLVLAQQVNAFTVTSSTGTLFPSVVICVCGGQSFPVTSSFCLHCPIPHHIHSLARLSQQQQQPVVLLPPVRSNPSTWRMIRSNAVYRSIRTANPTCGRLNRKFRSNKSHRRNRHNRHSLPEPVSESPRLPPPGFSPICPIPINFRKNK